MPPPEVPRKMLPPPITIPTSTPVRWTAASSRAMRLRTGAAIPYPPSPPASASPDSLRTTRLKRGFESGRDLHRELFRQVYELLVARDKVGLAVELDHGAQLAAMVHVGHDRAFLRLAAFLGHGLGRAALAQKHDRLLEVPAGLLEHLAAVH